MLNHTLSAALVKFFKSLTINVSHVMQMAAYNHDKVCFPQIYYVVQIVNVDYGGWAFSLAQR